MRAEPGLPRLARGLVVILLGACGGRAPASESAAIARSVAQDFVDSYYHSFPEEAYEVGYPHAPTDSLGDRSRAAMDLWRTKEDAWLSALRALDPADLEGTDALIPYVFTLDRLSASEGRRVCRTELWNVSPTWTGWQSMLASTVSQQAVATPEDRARALDRLRRVPAYIDTDVDNLRAGMAAGFLAARTSVQAVLGQVEALLLSPVEASPFHDPATRAGDDAFTQEVEAIILGGIGPAMQRYRDFLSTEYVPREAVGVAANPMGRECYDASVRFHTSLSMSAEEIHESGLGQMARIREEMSRIARDGFGTDDIAGLLQRLRTEPEYTFPSEEAILDYARSAVACAEVSVHDWFGFVPEAEVIVKPFPAYQQSSGGGFYSAGAVDGSRPGTYEVGTYRPDAVSRASMEATAFHETYPGHHLQFSVALYGRGVHPVLRYVYVAGMAEGWGLYSERLADEMGLYSSDLDRLGMLSNEALRAARMVVDPGMHVLGWTREQAIEYMLANTAESLPSVTSEIDRYIAVPGQATAYLLGSLEIQRLRRSAQERLGDRFDIKGFHDTVLGDGAVSLPMLAEAVDRWVAAR